MARVKEIPNTQPIGQRKPSIEDVYEELKAIHATLNELVADLKAIREVLPITED